MDLVILALFGFIVLWDSVAACLLVASLFFVNFLGRKKIRPRILVLIPAHNEASVIGATLAALKDAPCQVVVVADNCTDETPEIVKDSGARLVLHKTDLPSTKAKALWAGLMAVENLQWDYLLVLDADNLLSANFWEVIFKCLDHKPEVVQVEVRPLNRDASLTTKMITVTYGYLNRVVQRGRHVLGLGANLCGTGMIFRRDIVLERVPWSSEMGLVEDIYFQIRLSSAGIKPVWVDCAWVLDEKPRGYKAGIVQGSRWLRGRVEAMRAVLAFGMKNPLVGTTMLWKLVPKPIFWTVTFAIILNWFCHTLSWQNLLWLSLFAWFVWIFPSFAYKPYRVGPIALLYPFWQMATQILQLVQALWDRGRGWRHTKHFGA